MSSVVYPLTEAFKKALSETLKPDRSTPARRLSSYSLAAGESVNIDITDLSGWSTVIVAVRATYHESATAGVRIRWLYSPDGTEFDSPDDAEAQGNYEDLSFEAGKTRQRTILIPALAPNVRIQIVNLDSAYPVTIDAWTWTLR